MKFLVNQLHEDMMQLNSFVLAYINLLLTNLGWFSVGVNTFLLKIMFWH